MMNWGEKAGKHGKGRRMGDLQEGLGGRRRG